jgi:hypothetical protein
MVYNRVYTKYVTIYPQKEHTRMITELPPVDSKVSKMALDLLNKGKRKFERESSTCYRCKQQVITRDMVVVERISRGSRRRYSVRCCRECACVLHNSGIWGSIA